MKIKTKINLGLALLTTLILILSLVSSLNTNIIKQDIENILKANFNSLEYCKNMLTALESTNGNKFDLFEENLKKQKKNVTEVNEGKLTNHLEESFNHLRANTYDSVAYKSTRLALFEIMNQNMQAIYKKSITAKSTADNSILWILITSVLCFIIALVLLITLPSNVVTPIKELSIVTKEIISKNYAHRVVLKSKNEFNELADSFNIMASKLEEYNNSNLEKLMLEKRRIEILINNMHDPVFGFDENYKVIFANEEAINISGLNRESLVGRTADELSKNNDLMRLLVKDLMNLKEDKTNDSAPLTIFAEGKESYFELEIINISNKANDNTNEKENDNLDGQVILLRNVTQHKELDSAKTNFIANVSHEFKTPITSIQMSLQLLENEKIGKLNPEQTQLIESIDDDLLRLLNITEELLNMTQVESGHIQLNITAAEPKLILDYALHAIRTQADQKQISFVIDEPEAISNVMVDEEKTAWVLINLISNAIRYSYDNSKIKIVMFEDEDSIGIAVTDSGEGILPEYIDKVFERYFRIPGTNKKGTGLGLAISKEFVESQGGNIILESEYGLGSTFTITMKKSS